MAPQDSGVLYDGRMRLLLWRLGSSSRSRARKSEFLDELNEGNLEHRFLHQNSPIEVTGLEFKLVDIPDIMVKRPFAPSLDKTSSAGGYTPTVAVNSALGQWGEEIYLTFARADVEYYDEEVPSC